MAEPVKAPVPCVWMEDGLPAYWMPGEAWAFKDGWFAAPSLDVGMGAKVLSAEAFKERFPDLPPLPYIAFR